MDTFAWVWWRFGWARDDYSAVFGWRRVAGRLWVAVRS